jgi:predicted DsbA family dithiol-disulfide isomerase
VPLTSLFSRAQLEGMFQNLERLGTQYGIEFSGASMLPNSRLALKAGEFARENGRFDPFHEKMLHSYFAEGKNIGDIDVVQDITVKVGLDADELHRALEQKRYDEALMRARQEAAGHFIHAVPTFLIEGSRPIIGIQSLDLFRDTLKKYGKTE